MVKWVSYLNYDFVLNICMLPFVVIYMMVRYKSNLKFFIQYDMIKGFYYLISKKLTLHLPLEGWLMLLQCHCCINWNPEKTWVLFGCSLNEATREGLEASWAPPNVIGNWNSQLLLEGVQSLNFICYCVINPQTTFEK